MAADLASFDPLKSVEALTDPKATEFLATQLNQGTLNQNRAMGALSVRDLAEGIVDIIIGTAAQGASTLEVHITDPNWVLLTRPAGGKKPAFIDTDDSGLLIPVDVNFPEGTDSWWRLQAAEPTIDLTGPNLTLTFEDRRVVELRDVAGPASATKNETRAQFIARQVARVPGIRFVCPALAQPAGSVGGNITQGQLLNLSAQMGNTSPAPSALAPNAPSARRNPTKRAGIGRAGRSKAKGGTLLGGAVRGAGSVVPPVAQPSGPTVLSILDAPLNGGLTGVSGSVNAGG